MVCDMLGAVPAYMLMSLGQTVSVIWFAHINEGIGLYALAIFFGFFYSGVMSSIMVCTRMMVSGNFAGRAMSITSFFGWLGMGSGGFLGGYFYDLSGSYTWSFTFAMLAGVVNLLVLSFLLLRIKGRLKLPTLA